MIRFNNPRVEKIYPIEERNDFYKFAVMEGNEIAKDMNGDEMVFMDKEQAQRIADARERINYKYQ